MADLRARARAAVLDAGSVGLLACVVLPAGVLCLSAGAVAYLSLCSACDASVRAHDLRTGYRPGQVLWRGGSR